MNDLDLKSNVIRYYDAFHRGGSDVFQEATRWLCEFYKTPDSIRILIDVYNSLSSDNERLYPIIGLSKSIKHLWNSYNYEDKAKIFDLFLNMIKQEKSYLNRKNIYQIISSIIGDGFFVHLYKFLIDISEYDDIDDLRLILSLDKLLKVSSLPQDMADGLAKFLITQLDRGFSSDDIETKLLAFENMVFPNNIIDVVKKGGRFQIYWRSVLEIYPKCVESSHFYEKIIRFMKYCILLDFSEQLGIDPVSLLAETLKVLDIVSTDSNKLLLTFSLIENIIKHYLDSIISQEVVNHIILALVRGSNLVFNENDELVLTQANYFESSIEYLSRNTDILKHIYFFLSELPDTTANRFFILRSISNMFGNCRVFFLDYLEYIINLIVVSLSSNSLLLVEGAVSSCDAFMTYYSNESEDVSVAILSALLNVAKNSPNVEIITSLTSIIEKTQASERYFSEFFEYVVAVFSKTSDLNIQVSAAYLLFSIIDISEQNVKDNFDTIIQFLFQMLNSWKEEISDLISPIVDCISRVVSIVGVHFGEYLNHFLSFCVRFLGTPGYLGMSCFRSLENIIRYFPDVFISMSDEIIPFILDKAFKDYSEDYKRYIASNLPVMEDEIEYFEDYDINNFVMSMIATRCLSLLLSINKTFLVKYKNNAIQCISLHSHSINKDCRSAASFAIDNLVDAIVNIYGDLEGNITEEDLGYISQSILSIILQTDDINLDECCEAGFLTAAKLVDLLEYDVAFGIQTEPILSLTYNLITKIHKIPGASSRYSSLLDSISKFLKNMIASASYNSPKLLNKFIPFLYKILSSDNDPEFCDFCCEFFFDLISAAIFKLSQEFVTSLLQLSIKQIDERNLSVPPKMILLIYSIANSVPELVIPIAEKLASFCVIVFEADIVDNSKFLLLRDYSAALYSVLGLKVFGNCLNVSEIVVRFLSSLPLVIDYDVFYSVNEFFFWLFERSDVVYRDHFFRVLVVTFANSPDIIELMNILPNVILKMKNLCNQLRLSIDNSDKLISQYLNDDKTLIDYFNYNTCV